MSDYIIDFTGTFDATSPKTPFVIKPTTIDGPQNPHSPTPVNTAAHTSLKLPGKRVPNYGEFLAENQVFLLENFAATIPPVYPTSGQLWYDLTNNTMKVYNGLSWDAIQITVSSLAPTLPNIGHLWFDTGTDNVRVWNGTTWISVATGYLLADGSVPMTGNFDVGNNRIVNLATPLAPNDGATKLYVDNKNALNTPFTPAGNIVAVNTQLAIEELDFNKVARSGDTMTGLLTLSGDPTAPLEAATKQYVDNLFISPPFGLDALTDVTLTAVNNFDLLSYDNITNQWINRDLSSAGIAPASHGHLATEVSFVPYATTSSTDVQSAIEELTDEKVNKFGDLMTGFITFQTNIYPQTPNHAATKEYVDASDSTDRITLPTNNSDTLFSGVPYIVGTNRLDVFLYSTTPNTRRMRGSTSGHQIANFNQTIRNHIYTFTGIDTIMDAQTIFKAEASVSGATPTTRLIRIKGANLITFGDVINQIQNGFQETIIDLDDTLGTLDIQGDYTDLFVAGTLFEIFGSSTNNGVYEVSSSSFAGGLTTITITGTFQPSGLGIGILRANGHNAFTDLPISNIDDVTNEIEIPGNYEALFVSGYTFHVTNSSTNDGRYTVDVAGATYSGGITTIPITGSFTTPGLSLGNIKASVLQPAIKVSISGRNLKFENVASYGNTSTITLTDGPTDNLFTALNGFVNFLSGVSGNTGDYDEDYSFSDPLGYFDGNKWISTQITFGTAPAAGTLEIVSRGAL